MGEKWLQEFLGLCFLSVLKKQFWNSVYFQAISPPCLGLCFFQTTKNEKFPLYPFLIFFNTRVLETHLGGLKAACMGPVLSKFRLSVGDGATKSFSPGVL